MVASVLCEIFPQSTSLVTDGNGLLPAWELIGSVLHQDEGGIGKSIPDAQEISQDPKDIPRAKPEGNLEGRGKFRAVSRDRNGRG